MKLPLIRTRFLIFHPHSYGIATLMRLGLRTRPGGPGIFLHHFRPHVEEKFHDHPWPFRTLVLWGGYVDESIAPDGSIVRDELRLGSRRTRHARHCHRTTSAHGAVTLVITGAKERNWCEGEPGEWSCDGDSEDFDTTRGRPKDVKR